MTGGQAIALSSAAMLADVTWLPWATRPTRPLLCREPVVDGKVDKLMAPHRCQNVVDIYIYIYIAEILLLYAH